MLLGLLVSVDSTGTTVSQGTRCKAHSFVRVGHGYDAMRDSNKFVSTTISLIEKVLWNGMCFSMHHASLPPFGKTAGQC